MCHLRLGELENCLSNHTSDSCIFPIGGSGVHLFQRGSRGAVAVLSGLLDEQPGNLAARWLLNVAYMTLGEYPDKVPPKWLIPAKVFESDYQIPRFYDVAGNLLRADNADVEVSFTYDKLDRRSSENERVGHNRLLEPLVTLRRKIRASRKDGA